MNSLLYSLSTICLTPDMLHIAWHSSQEQTVVLVTLHVKMMIVFQFDARTSNRHEGRKKETQIKIIGKQRNKPIHYILGLLCKGMRSNTKFVLNREIKLLLVKIAFNSNLIVAQFIKICQRNTEFKAFLCIPLRKVLDNMTSTVSNVSNVL